MVFLFKVLLCFLIYGLTYYLNHKRQWGAVKASASIALLLGLGYQVLMYNEVHTNYNDYFLIMMGATFMGMISDIHQHKIMDFIISSFIFCALYTNSSEFFHGLGGLLGTIACISILCVFGIERLLQKL